MLFKSFPASGELHPYVSEYQVRHFIVPEGFVQTPKPYVVRPEETMAFYIRGRESTRVIADREELSRPRSVLTGLWTGRIDRVSMGSEFYMLQVIFKPGGLYKITGIPSHELLNRIVDLTDLYPAAIRTLHHKFDDETDYHFVVKEVDRFLAQLMKRKNPEHFLYEDTFSLLQRSQNQYSITKLAGDACLSLRQFERKALLHLGVNLSTYQRISRFAQSFKMKTKNPKLSWTQIAIQSGYYDYQHLSRDYKAFSFSSPNNLFATDQVSLEKVLKLGDGYS